MDRVGLGGKRFRLPNIRLGQSTASGRLTAEKLTVARDFFRSFADPTARNLVKELKIDNYTAAIMAHHPQAARLRRTDIAAKVNRLVALIFDRLDACKHRPETLLSELRGLSRSSDRPGVWFPEYNAAYTRYKHQVKPRNRDAILFPFVVGRSLVDIGCGGGDQAAYFRTAHHDRLKIVAGIDVLNWKTPGLDIDYHPLDFSRAGTISPRQYETGLLLAVLHHIGRTDREVTTFLSGVNTAVSKRLIVEEDVIVTPADLKLPLPGIEGFAKQRKSQPFLDRYLDLSPRTQMNATVLLDVLTNALSVGVPDMAFPFGFRTIDNWVKLFARNGFALEQVKVLGFQANNFNQACHLLFILDKVA